MKRAKTRSILLVRKSAKKNGLRNAQRQMLRIRNKQKDALYGGKDIEGRESYHIGERKIQRVESHLGGNEEHVSGSWGFDLGAHLIKSPLRCVIECFP